MSWYNAESFAMQSPSDLVSYLSSEIGSCQVENKKAGISLVESDFFDKIHLWGTAITGGRSVLLRRGTIPLTTGKTGKGGIAYE